MTAGATRSFRRLAVSHNRRTISILFGVCIAAVLLFALVAHVLFSLWTGFAAVGESLHSQLFAQLGIGATVLVALLLERSTWRSRPRDASESLTRAFMTWVGLVLWVSISAQSGSVLAWAALRHEHLADLVGALPASTILSAMALFIAVEDRDTLMADRYAAARNLARTRAMTLRTSARGRRPWAAITAHMLLLGFAALLTTSLVGTESADHTLIFWMSLSITVTSFAILALLSSLRWSTWNLLVRGWCAVTGISTIAGLALTHIIVLDRLAAELWVSFSLPLVVAAFLVVSFFASPPPHRSFQRSLSLAAIGIAGGRKALKRLLELDLARFRYTAAEASDAGIIEKSNSLHRP